MNKLIFAAIATATTGSSGTFVGLERLKSHHVGQMHKMKRQSEDRTIEFTREKIQLNEETAQHQGKYKALIDAKSKPLIGYLAQAVDKLKKDKRDAMSMCKLNPDQKGVKFCKNIDVQPEALSYLYNYKEPKKTLVETPV